MNSGSLDTLHSYALDTDTLDSDALDTDTLDSDTLNTEQSTQSRTQYTESEDYVST